MFDDPLLTPPEVAAYLKVPARTIERWRASGSGPRFLKLGRRVAYRQRDVAAWLDARVRTHTAETRVA